jgi:hypothetical protein
LSRKLKRSITYVQRYDPTVGLIGKMAETLLSVVIFFDSVDDSAAVHFMATRISLYLLVTAYDWPILATMLPKTGWWRSAGRGYSEPPTRTHKCAMAFWPSRLARSTRTM